MLNLFFETFTRTLDRLGVKWEQFLYLLVFVLFWIKGIVFLDPDFGWRLKTGEYILHNGIPKTDLFTYSMPSFPWVDHAWSQSLVFAYLYPIVGKIGLSAFYSVLALLTLKIINSAVSEKAGKVLRSVYMRSLGLNYGDFSNFIFLLSISLLFVFFGVRVQVVTWLMLAIMLRIVFDEKLWKRFRIFSPPFFMIWVNLHGGFFSGITILLLVLGSRILKTRKVDSTDLFVFTGSLLATFINPYKLSLWREVLSSVTDAKLRWTINEWMPALTMLNLPMIILGTFTTIFVWKQRKNIGLEKLLLFAFFLIQAIGSRRHIPLFVLIALPTTAEAIAAFRNELKRTKDGLKRLYVAYKWAWVGVLVIILFQLIFDFSEGISLREKGYYPKDAVSYLKTASYQGELFSEYGWGGYLIWKLPGRSVYIDGRMPSWRWNAPPSETDSAFDDYSDLLKGEMDYREIFDKYNVSVVLWTKPKEDSALDALFEKAENFLQRFGYKKRDFKLVKQLEKDNWIRVYEDDKAVVLEKP